MKIYKAVALIAVAQSACVAVVAAEANNPEAAAQAAAIASLRQ